MEKQRMGDIIKKYPCDGRGGWAAEAVAAAVVDNAMV